MDLNNEYKTRLVMWYPLINIIIYFCTSKNQSENDLHYTTLTIFSTIYISARQKPNVKTIYTIPPLPS